MRSGKAPSRQHVHSKQHKMVWQKCFKIVHTLALLFCLLTALPSHYPAVSLPCRLTTLPSHCPAQYDVVTDFLCLAAACATIEDYKAALVRLHALLKPGGKTVLYTVHCKDALTPASYPVGPHNFLPYVSQGMSFSSHWSMLAFMM